MNRSLVSERYARALFHLAVEEKAEEAVFLDMQLISKACGEIRELRMLLDSPVINSGKKLTVLSELFRDKLHRITFSYVLVMVRKKREAFIPAIARELEELYLSYRNILKVKFLSPTPPDAETRRQVLTLMESYSKATVDLQTETDESLIGGFVLKWNDLQYDASIRREIENLRTATARINLYKKGF